MFGSSLPPVVANIRTKTVGIVPLHTVSIGLFVWSDKF